MQLLVLGPALSPLETGGSIVRLSTRRGDKVPRVPSGIRIALEYTTLAVDMNDRLGRRLILSLNNDQQCVTAAWIEEDKAVQYDKQISNQQLYEMLAR